MCKKIKILLFSLVMLFLLAPVKVSAEQIASGTCGEKLTWSLTGEGILTISGEGGMEDYSNNAPWNSLKEEIYKVIIKEGVTTIGEDAFCGCVNLTEIILPEGITSIGTNALFWCQKLTDIILPDSVTSISDYAFQCCENLSCINIPKNVTNIGANAFSSCNQLSEINVDNDNSYYSSLNGVLFDKEQSILIAFPAGISSTYIVPEGVASIEDYAFQYSNLNSVIISEGVVSIGANAFEYCEKLNSVIIPDSVTTIGRNAFYFCSNLMSITIPKNVTNIGRGAFIYCNNSPIKVNTIICKTCKLARTQTGFQKENYNNTILPYMLFIRLVKFQNIFLCKLNRILFFI